MSKKTRKAATKAARKTQTAGTVPPVVKSPETFSLVGDSTVSETATATATPTPKAKGEQKQKAPKAPKQVAAELKVLASLAVHPSQVELSDDLRGRVVPVGEPEIITLAESIRKNGQLQAIQVRETAKPGVYQCVFGNTRKMACDRLVSGYTNNEGKEIPGNPETRIRVEVVDCDLETAFVNNVVENATRNACTPMDNARNQQRMRDEFGYSDVRIAALFGYSSSASCTQYKKLLRLEPEYQDAVNNGTLTFSAAQLLADVQVFKEGTRDDVDEEATTKARAIVWLAAVDASKDLDAIASREMANAIKKWRASLRQLPNTPEAGTTPATAPEAGTAGTTPAVPTATTPAVSGSGRVALSVKDIKATLSAFAEDAKCPAAVAEFCVVFTKFVANEIEATELATWLKEHVS